MRHIPVFGTIGMLALMILLRTAAFPVPWFAPVATLLLPPLCLCPALYFAVRRRTQLRQATQRHQAEQKRLMAACRLIHARADALYAEKCELLAQIDALQEQCAALQESANTVPVSKLA